jgi:hypothetical protein
MVAMTVLCGAKIRYIRLLFYLVCDDLTGDVEEGGKSSSRCFHRKVDLI